MTTYVALLRGINIGGNHMLSMKDLAALFTQNGCVGVRTYIQSGNVVFGSAAGDVPRLARQLTAAVASRHGFEPRVVVLTRRELERAAAGNPFPEAANDPKSVHLFFLAEPARKPDAAAMESLKSKSERYALKGKIFYLYTPDGFGISKLAARAERLLGVDATARNWRTVTTLVEMARTFQCE